MGNLARGQQEARPQPRLHPRPQAFPRMSHRFCTYFDSRYLPKGLAMYHSLRKHLGEVELWVLCLDEKARDMLAKRRLPGIKLLTLPELEAADPELAARKSERRLVEYYFTS